MLIGARTTMFSGGQQKTLLPAYSFYKNNYGYADVGSPDGMSALSFGGWFKLIEKSNQGNLYLVCGWSQSAGYGSTHILGRNSFRFGTGSGSTIFSIQGGALPEGKWVHCVASYDGQKCRFFRNGVLDSEYDTGPITLRNNAGQFRIASFNEGSLKYSSVGACQVFVLGRGITTEAEVKQLMGEAGVMRLAGDPSLIGAWKMDSPTNGYFTGLTETNLYISTNAQETKGPAVEPVDYAAEGGLRFTAVEANSTVSMKKTGSPPAVSLKYSLDGRRWKPFIVDETTVTLSSAGDSVYIAADPENAAFATSNSNYNGFLMTGKVAASGNVMGLLDRTMVKRSFDQSYALGCLFSQCSSLVSPPELPATQLSTSCYRYMFSECTQLSAAPALPASRAYNYCYAHMFYGCSSLVAPPALPAQELGLACYQRMFFDCASLSAAPVLPA